MNTFYTHGTDHLRPGWYTEYDHYLIGPYSTLWAAVAAALPFDDEIDADAFNAAWVTPEGEDIMGELAFS